MSLRPIHTYVTLDVPRKAYDFVHKALEDAGYHQAFDAADPANGPIDMHGIALTPLDVIGDSACDCGRAHDCCEFPLCKEGLAS